MKLSFLVFILFINGVAAQEKIVLLNGKVKQVYHVDGLVDKNIVYTVDSFGDTRSISINKVFSAIAHNGKEKVYYRQDSAVDYFLTPEQMRSFIKGEQKAMADYKGTGYYFLGGISGILGVSILPFVPPLSLLPVAGGMLTCNLSPNVSAIPLEDQKLIEKEDFLLGYRQRARTRRVRNGMIGASIGITGGFLVLLASGFASR